VYTIDLFDITKSRSSLARGYEVIGVVRAKTMLILVTLQTSRFGGKCMSLHKPTLFLMTLIKIMSRFG